MKSKLVIAALLISISAVALILINNKQPIIESTDDVTYESQQKKTSKSEQQSSAITRPTPAVPRSPEEQKENREIKEAISSYSPLTEKEIQSVNQITKAIGQSLAKKMNSNQFMKLLNDLKLSPKFMDEGSSSMGSFVTVRTNNALEGTRYLHAQFTGEHQNADYLQHISFQIRPGKDSFENAVKILGSILPKDKITKESYDDYVLYNTHDGYVAWVKIANKDDLKTNKYNAASKEDIGTIIVTIEQEIHDMDEDHSH